MAIKNIEQVEEAIGVEKGKLSEMISSDDEHEVDLTGRVFQSKEDHDAKMINIKKEAGTAAVEIAVKEARKTLNYEFTGKTIDNLLSAHSDKVLADAKIEPDKKYDILKTDFVTLQTNLTKKTEEFDAYKLDVQGDTVKRKNESKVMKAIPSDDKLIIPGAAAMVLFNQQYTVSQNEEGKDVIKNAAGEILKNKDNLNPLTLAEVMPDFIKPYVKKAEGGAGKGDETGEAKEGTYEAFEKEMEKKEIRGEALNIEMQKRIKGGTLKM